MVTNDTKIGGNCDDRQKPKYNSKIPTAVTWLPPQYAKQQVLKFRLGTHVTTLRRPCLNPKHVGGRQDLVVM